MPGLPPNFTLPHAFAGGGTAFANDVLGNDADVRDALNLAAFGQGTLAARPAANTVKSGYVYLATDDWGGTAYISNGSIWTQIASRDRRVMSLVADGGVHDFTGLDGDADMAYELEWAFYANAPGGPFWLRFNDDQGNHYTPDEVTDGSNHAMLLTATGIGASRQTGRVLIGALTKAATRRVVSIDSATYTDAGVGSSLSDVGTWSNVVDKITKISVSQQFNAIDGVVILRRLR